MNPGIVWAYLLPKKTWKAYGFDNANKISKSTTASGSANVNGIVISVFSFSKGQEVIKLFDIKKPDGNKKLKPPDYYNNILPMAKDKYEIPDIKNEGVEGNGMKTELHEGQEMKWLTKVVEVVSSEEVIDKNTNTSWAISHAGQAPQIQNETVQLQILPVFTETSNTLAMVKRCLTVLLWAHSFTNPHETSWVTVDQPLIKHIERNILLEFLVLFT